MSSTRAYVAPRCAQLNSQATSQANGLRHMAIVGHTAAPDTPTSQPTQQVEALKVSVLEELSAAMLASTDSLLNWRDTGLKNTSLRSSPPLSRHSGGIGPLRIALGCLSPNYPPEIGGVHLSSRERPIRIGPRPCAPRFSPVSIPLKNA